MYIKDINLPLCTEFKLPSLCCYVSHAFLSWPSSAFRVDASHRHGLAEGSYYNSRKHSVLLRVRKRRGTIQHSAMKKSGIQILVLRTTTSWNPGRVTKVAAGTHMMSVGLKYHMKEL